MTDLFRLAFAYDTIEEAAPVLEETVLEEATEKKNKVKTAADEEDEIAAARREKKRLQRQQKKAKLDQWLEEKDRELLENADEKNARSEGDAGNSQKKKKREKKSESTAAKPTKKTKKEQAAAAAALAEERNDRSERLEEEMADREMEIEGIVVGDEMYLRDKAQGIVYSSIRDDEGELVRIGTWNDKTKSVDLDSEKREKREKKRKEREDEEEANEENEEEEENFVQESEAVMPESLPFVVESDDHCETSRQAYVDISNFLHRLAKSLKKKPSELKIYDPYYCAGSVIKNLASVGFPNVYNKCEDFYVVKREGGLPEFDVLITNPPYSGNNIEHIVRFCCQNSKPFFLLLPNYVYMQEWYASAIKKAHGKMVYLCPAKRYSYFSPKGARNIPNSENKTSPFVSFWYVCLFTHSGDVLSWWKKTHGWKDDITLVKSTWQLPKNMLSDWDPRKKRPRKNQRDARKRAAKASEEGPAKPQNEDD